MELSVTTLAVALCCVALLLRLLWSLRHLVVWACVQLGVAAAVLYWYEVRTSPEAQARVASDVLWLTAALGDLGQVLQRFLGRNFTQ